MAERPNIFPALRYRDADAAIEWLVSAFSFEKSAVYRDDAGVVQHAELRLGAGIVMLGQARPGDFLEGAAAEGGSTTHTIYAVVEDPDRHYERACAAGAEILQELREEDYGSREYSARDLEGNVWSFGTYDPYAG